MGYRLSKIYTRTGDKGTTGLGDGSRVRKNDPRVEAYGTVDEINSVIGLLLAGEVPEAVRDCLTDIQHDLFDLGGELSVPGFVAIDARYVSWLEQVLDRFNAELPPLAEFILPGGTAAAATCHLARTVCRRAERLVAGLAPEAGINPEAIAYLNRLSDLLFVLSRALNAAAGVPDVLWKKNRRRDAGHSGDA